MKEIWRNIDLKKYEVSNLGNIRSKPRTVERIDRWGNYYNFNYTGKLLNQRTNGIEKHLFVSVEYYNERTFEKIRTSLYVHKAVATAFVKNPDPKHLDKVTHKDGNIQNNLPSNLKWTNQSHLSKKMMGEASEKTRRRIGEFQKNKGNTYSKKTIDEVKRLYKEGIKIYLIGEKVGYSMSWGYNNIPKILKM